MSNDNAGTPDELQAIADAKLVIEDPDSTEEDKENAQQVVDKSEADEKVKADRREKSHQDLLRSEFTKVANDEKKLEDVPEWLREEVQVKIKKLTPKTETTDEDKIVERIKIETQLDSVKADLSEEEAKELETLYSDFKAHGYTLAEALAKSKRQLGILSPIEKERQAQIEGMRAIPTSRSQSPSQSTEARKIEQKYMDNLPDYIKKLQKV